MDVWLLTSDAFQEPWTLWTRHLAHRNWQHGADGLLALAIPFLMVPRKHRLRLGAWMFLLAPVLSLGVEPFMNGRDWGGLSSLACAAWVMAGLQLLAREDSAPVGVLMLMLLCGKFAFESMTGMGFLNHSGRWQDISLPHVGGAIAGFAAGGLDDSLRRMETKLKCAVTGYLR